MTSWIFIGILLFDITEFIVKSSDGVAELIQIRVWLGRSLISTSSGRGELSGSPMALRWMPVGFNPPSINYPSMKISQLNLMQINVLPCLSLRPRRLPSITHQ